MACVHARHAHLGASKTELVGGQMYMRPAQAQQHSQLWPRTHHTALNSIVQKRMGPSPAEMHRTPCTLQIPLCLKAPLRRST